MKLCRRGCGFRLRRVDRGRRVCRGRFSCSATPRQTSDIQQWCGAGRNVTRFELDDGPASTGRLRLPVPHVLADCTSQCYANESGCDRAEVSSYLPEGTSAMNHLSQRAEGPKVRATLYLSADLLDQARNAAVHTGRFSRPTDAGQAGRQRPAGRTEATQGPIQRGPELPSPRCRLARRPANRRIGTNSAVEARTGSGQCLPVSQTLADCSCRTVPVTFFSSAADLNPRYGNARSLQKTDRRLSRYRAVAAAAAIAATHCQERSAPAESIRRANVRQELDQSPCFGRHLR